MKDYINSYLFSLDNQAIGAFYFNNLLFLQGIISAMQRKEKKAFVMVTPNVIGFLGRRYVIGLKNIAKDICKHDIFFQLDHANDIETARFCIDNGFDAIMVDMANLKDNIKLTKQVVEMAHARNVWVEGQLGVIEGTKYQNGTVITKTVFPEIDELIQYVEETHVDALAVPFGVKHKYVEDVDSSALRLDLLGKYWEAVNIPLVMHGADTIPAGEIKKSIGRGVKKVNFGPVLKDVFLKSLADRLRAPFHESDMRDILILARDAVQKVTEEKIEICS